MNTTETLDIHPSAFGMIECWLSDTVSPVAIELNLDAIDANNDQFYWDETEQRVRTVDVDGVRQEWIQSDDGKGFQRYRLIEAKDGVYVVTYQNNGGGNLTTSCTIGFKFDRRILTVNGDPTSIRVLRVVSYQANQQKKTRGPN